MAHLSFAHSAAQVGVRAAILGLFLVGAATAGYPQAPARGALTGMVADDNNLPLPGTTVTIVSSAIPTGLRSTVTDERGRYQFNQLPGATYEVAFALMGFKRRIVEGVVIPAGTRMGLTGRMTLGSIEERQVVASDAVSLGAAEAETPTGDPNRASDAAPIASTATDAIAAPERLVTVLPRYPRDATRGTAGTVSVMLTLDAAGRPFNVQPAPEHDIMGLRDVDGVLAAAPEPGQNFRTAAVDAVTRWVYAPPVQGDLTLLVQFTFLAEGRVRLVRQHIVEPVQAGLAPGDRFQVGTTR